MNHQQRKRRPQAKDIVLVGRILLAVFPMANLSHGWSESLKGVTNYRIQSSVNEKELVVDVYVGGFYVIRVGSATRICKSIPSLVGCLGRMLGIGFGK